MLGLREVDGTSIQKKHKLTCHCGCVEIELDLPKGLEDVRRCDCSLCRRRGAIVASAPLKNIKILKGHEMLYSSDFKMQYSERCHSVEFKENNAAK
ncbi:hypothetical protein [Vibrio caribbeanicus]|uniref:hypothetical protein n=1 Tax=Vibrio caribbeanicus TaxID=701175 RepID=UPI002E10BC10